MSGLSWKKIGRFTQILQPHFDSKLSEYVTALDWSPDGNVLAASSAVGEVICWQEKDTLSTLQSSVGESIDCLSFSANGKLLAAGGQDGRVRVWRWGENPQLIANLENAPAWVDRLAWSPTGNYLAFSLGRYVQVWDANSSNIVITLNFETSSVLSLAWHPAGERLAIGGYQGVKIWHSGDWDEDPNLLDIPSASLAIAWSPDGKYLASGNFDRTVAVFKWGHPYPWRMQGFPGKVRQLAWSDRPTANGAPLLAVASAENIIVWEKQPSDDEGWDGWMLEMHSGTVSAIAFQPGTFLLASASEDGRVCLWQKAEQAKQLLAGATQGFSSLAWHPQGQRLAAGGRNGELFVWCKSQRGQGFGG